MLQFARPTLRYNGMWPCPLWLCRCVSPTSQESSLRTTQFTVQQLPCWTLYLQRMIWNLVRCSDYGGKWDGDEQRGAPKVDQREGKEEHADFHRGAREMQSAAISAGKERETGCPPHDAFWVSTILPLVKALWTIINYFILSCYHCGKPLFISYNSSLFIACCQYRGDLRCYLISKCHDDLHSWDNWNLIKLWETKWEGQTTSHFRIWIVVRICFFYKFNYVLKIKDLISPTVVIYSANTFLLSLANSLHHCYAKCLV